MDPAILEKIGFTRTESIVYLTLLQTGTCKTGDLLKQAGLNSGKIYEILENLKTKALVSESIINQVKHFTAAPPAKLLEYVEKKKIDLEKEETAIRSMLPQLNVLRKVTSQRVKAVTYLGLQGIRTALEECLESMKPSEESLVMGATGKKDPKINAFLLRFQLKRIQRKITMRMIFSERAAYFKQFQTLAYTKIRVLTGLTPVTVDVFGEDKVLILNYAEPTSCILIYDKNTAISFKYFFEQLWNIAKP